MNRDNVPQEKPNYYSIITADVRYDNRLSANEKLLFSEITALTYKNGYCNATNSYFANLYEVDTRTVKRWISNLINCGYLKSYVERNDSYVVSSRKLYLITPTPGDKNVPRVGQNCPEGGDKNVPPPGDKNVPYNNTSNNNTSNNNIYSRAEPDQVSEIPYQEIIDYLNNKTGKQYKSTSKKTRDLIKARYSEGFILDDFKEVIDNKYSDWGGKDMAKYLRPETLFSNKFEGYLNEEHKTSSRDDSWFEGLGW